MWNGIYDVIDLAPETIQKLRIPPAVHGYLLIVLLVSVVPRRWVKPFVLYSGLLFIWLFMGASFAIGVVASSLVVYAVTPWLVRRARRTGRPAPPTALGWSIIHLMYLPCFFVTLPQIQGMQLGELTQFCGVGFMVLKASQYVWDSCRGRIGPVRWDEFLLFMTFLPTFRLGPVDRCGHFLEELETCKSRINRRNVAYGLYRVAAGTVKMLVVVHLIEKNFFPDPYNIPFGQHFFDHAAGEPVGAVWLQAYAFFLRLYLIFSGYSDGAIGMCLIMGIRAPENFRWPLLCTNLTDFWRRWHISMSTWLRDYVYIPLGGGRRHATLNVLVVFVYCGLWHYPVFAGPLLFGLVQMTALSLTRRWGSYVDSRRREPTPLFALLRAIGLAGGWTGRILGWAITFHVMVFTALFMLDHKHSGLLVVGRMFGL
jgi:alginate O-acetyltransferase complex protein AlgI